MQERITNKRLELAVRTLNEALGYPIAPYKEVTNDSGERIKLEPQANCIYVAGAYGGVRLEQMAESGGSRNVTDGYGTKREAYDAAQAMLWAIRELNAQRQRGNL